MAVEVAEVAKASLTIGTDQTLECFGAYHASSLSLNQVDWGVRIPGFRSDRATPPSSSLSWSPVVYEELCSNDAVLADVVTVNGFVADIISGNNVSADLENPPVIMILWSPALRGLCKECLVILA